MRRPSTPWDHRSLAFLPRVTTLPTFMHMPTLHTYWHRRFIRQRAFSRAHAPAHTTAGAHTCRYPKHCTHTTATYFLPCLHATHCHHGIMDQDRMTMAKHFTTPPASVLRSAYIVGWDRSLSHLALCYMPVRTRRCPTPAAIGLYLARRRAGGRTSAEIILPAATATAR